MPNNAPATVLPVFGPPRVGPLSVEDDRTHSGLTLGGPNTSSTVAGSLLGSPGENVDKVGTILPLSYQPLMEDIEDAEIVINAEDIQDAKIAEDIGDGNDIENLEIAEDIKDGDIVSISQILDMYVQALFPKVIKH